ncbi:MAG: DUF3192 domain-containing protein [Candidatus Aceula meridiana]|nr:DUF3192 domain-containing protein [Candidatus Aceula meridiana]
MKRILIVLMCLALAGCSVISVYKKTALENETNLKMLSVGMSKQEVLSIMGTETKKGGYLDDYQSVDNPHKIEVIDVGRQTFEVVYYFTSTRDDRMGGKYEPIKFQELTPLLFQKGKLVGWGADFMRNNVPQYDLLRFQHLL